MNSPSFGLTFGERLEYIRNDHELTIKAMAASVGVSPQTWRNYELDRSFPSRKTIAALCSIYHINREWLDTSEGKIYLDGERSGEHPGEPIDYTQKWQEVLQKLRGEQADQNLQDVLPFFDDIPPKEELEIIINSLGDTREAMCGLEDELKSDSLREACVYIDKAIECLLGLYKEKGWYDPYE